LKFETTAETELRISLCDAQGRVVQVFSEGEKYQVGEHSVPLPFDAGLPSGSYFLRISDGKGVVSVQVFKK
jgi:hypothetical protein